MKGILAMALAALAGLCTQVPPETKDRLSPDKMERLVAGPMAAVREDGLAAGDAVFERLRAAEAARSGPAGVGVADLLTAYAVELYGEWVSTEDRALLQASRDRLLAAITAYRAAFGPDHPEVAVALHSFADVDIPLNDGRATPQAEAALREALRIRRAALGPRHPETRAAEDRLASIAGAGTGKGAAGRALDEASAALRK
ncbi:MAG TPA: tetratricopeptide repeat protein [Allosphingosinicella sp.]|nr:tetratricopeptide repeat protein [Allosphingosinicella sp.]